MPRMEPDPINDFRYDHGWDKPPRNEVAEAVRMIVEILPLESQRRLILERMLMKGNRRHAA